MQGDLCLERLGIDDEAFAMLRDRVQVVFHVAASVWPSCDLWMPSNNMAHSALQVEFNSPLDEAVRTNCVGGVHAMEVLRRKGISP